MTDEPTSQDEIQAHLAESASRRRTTLLLGGGVAVVVAALLVYFLAIRDPGGDDEDLVKLRIADTAQSDYQDAMVDVGKENGLDLEFVNFSDPVLPNTALVEGEVDANMFQHVAFLSQFNMENDEEVTPMYSMFISTWGLFSDKHDSLEDLPAGARIAVPSDPSNLARSLFILQSAGLLEIDPDSGVFPTADDITENPTDIELVQLAHENTHTAYSDPAIDGVVDGVDEFDPALEVTPEEALQLEDATAESSSPYVIVTATMPDRVDDPVWETLEETFRDERVQKALQEEKGGQVTDVQVPVDNIRAALAELTS
jgi:D-methionine transport system substrate-binding protein